MPEIKHVFTQGKMNKDLDERLVPNGQYRDAMNIQVSTSEGSDVGVVQNILGNTNLFPENQIAPGSVCVGAIADEKNNCFYWFVYHNTKNLILKYDGRYITFVFVDTDNILKFRALNTITGINIIDEFLLWTDDVSEPKKINIQRCIDGTNQTGSYHTHLIVPERFITVENCIKVREEHITVIKKSPKTKLVLDPVFEEKITSTVTFDFDPDGDGELMSTGQESIIVFNNFSPSGSSYDIGDTILLLNSDSENNLPDTFDVKIKLVEKIIGATPADYQPNMFKFKLVTISSGVNLGVQSYNCLKQAPELIFSRKFVRFGYRYKFTDGEYSSFSPFTDPLFKPGDFEYNSLKAYNTAMENNLLSLKLRNFVTAEMPEDVVQVDILYKESNSPTVYIVDKIKYDDSKTITVGTPHNLQEVSFWDANLYEIKQDLIYAVVAENQLLRLWDNVPRKAKAQEVTGNRVVYANYLQNYNLTNQLGKNIKPLIKGDYMSRYVENESIKFNYDGNYSDTVRPSNENIELGFGQKSLKSLRNYQLGITYLDKYNRETPVFTSVEASFNIPKRHAAFKTKMSGEVLTPPPSWAHSFKVYVKETATEYYNMAMNRAYRAEDGVMWLAFPSSERNKIDEETFLILKKGVDSNALIQKEAKYKVLAIENEVPEYIKTEIEVLADFNCSVLSDNFSASNSPTEGKRRIDLNITEVNKHVEKLDEIAKTLHISFATGNTFTEKYKVKAISVDSSSSSQYYNITLEEEFKVTDAEFFYTDYPTNTTVPSDLTITIYQSEQVMKPEFEGVFFVKISSDATTERHVTPFSEGSTTFQTQENLFAHYFSDTNNPNTTVTGTTGFLKSDTEGEWRQNLDFGGSSNNILTTPPPGPIGGFFIDDAFYVDTHDRPLTEDIGGFVGKGNGYGKGVYTENGKHYVELSFSKIGTKAAKGNGIANLKTTITLIKTYDLALDGPDGNFPDCDLNEDFIWEPGNNQNSLDDYQNHYGGTNDQLFRIISKLTVGQRFRISNDDDRNNIYEIKGVQTERRYNHTPWYYVKSALTNFDISIQPGGILFANHAQALKNFKKDWQLFGQNHNRRITYILELDHSLEDVSTSNSSELLNTNNISASKALVMQFIKSKIVDDSEGIVSKNPAIWETEPKETAELDIYYEASEAMPLNINEKTIERFIPRGSVVTCPALVNVINPNSLTYVLRGEENIIFLNKQLDLVVYESSTETPLLVFTREDGTETSAFINISETQRLQNISSFYSNAYALETNVANNPFALSWYNCFSFNNGVESNRIRDDFNQPIIDKGAKVSTILEEAYEEERRTSGLIYSGIYNTDSGINNLNQFIQAEKITKDLNPTYGSIQKLFQRRIHLIAFCEDRVIKILSNKDALYNADGNVNLTATDRVLGDANPFAGDYGISKNPESFAKDNYRAYFTDKQRGAVLRLSMDGITPISEYGMSDYFKDNLKFGDIITGSFDTRKGEYNLTMPGIQKTISFKESVNGWSSFKSFIPKEGISMSGDYYTIKDGLPYRHHDEGVDRNTFYNEYTPSSVSVLLNDMPSAIKMYKTLGYEGSQSNINKDISGVETGYYNLEDKDGWKSKIKTDKQNGVVSEFIEKEGKWFNFIKGVNFDEVVDLKTKEFSFQGVGRPVDFEIDPNKYAPVVGCTNPKAKNYDSKATIDDGSCQFDIIDPEQPVGGCMDPEAPNYNPDATYDDGSCEILCTPILGCTNPNSINFNPKATEDDGSCIPIVYGCTDSRASNYNPNANVDDGSCYLADPDPDPTVSLTIKDSNDPDTNVIPPQGS